MYVCEWIFTRWKLDYRLTENAEKFEKYRGEKIWYGTENKAEYCSIKPIGLLEDDSLKRIPVSVSSVEDIPVIFPNGGKLGFDIFSAVFYMISRYEEYLPFQPDEHGRFPAKESIAYQHDFLETPVVDRWIDLFQKHLKRDFPKLIFADNRFQAIFTYDIDVAYKYKGRNVVTWSGGLLKEIMKFDLKSATSRLKVLLKKQMDPWDVYHFLRGDLQQTESRFFFLVGSRSKHDHNLDPNAAAMKRLMHEVGSFSSIGLHPSYNTYCNIDLLRSEKKTLEDILGKQIHCTRQHYLKFKVPETFLNLLDAGFIEDYSMAFPEAPGFRAGTAWPFYFYDLKNEKITNLKLYPCCWMDFTFSDYLKLDWDTALEQALKFVKMIQKSGGVFITIFHNHLLEDESLRDIHSKLVAETLKHG